jgi:hypothetical protein
MVLEQHMRRHRIGFIAFTSVIAAASLATAATTGLNPSAPQRTAWSTYMRSGPGETYPVIDELEHDSLVIVSGCGDRWCRVENGGISGYIDKDALVLPAPPSASAPPGSAESCFVADQAGYRHPAPTQFCQTQPMGYATSH